MRRTLPIVLLVGAATLAGCGGTANVEGDFSINVANRENGCGFDNWDGNTAANIPVGITQDGESATATVGGLTATFLDLWLGGHVFNGSVDGSHLDLTLTGTRAQSQGACAYTYDAVIDGIDHMATKLHLLRTCVARGLPVFAVSTKTGTGLQALTSVPVGEQFTVSRIPEELEFTPGLLDFLERSRVIPGSAGTVVAASPDGTMTVQIEGTTVGLGTFASERILVIASRPAPAPAPAPARTRRARKSVSA